MPNTHRAVTALLVPVCCVALAAAEDAVVEWAKVNAVPLRTVEFTAAADDLAALPEMIGDARVIGIGESAHGVHEFLTIRHRLVAYMVTHMDVRAVCLESGFAESRVVDDYVTGRSDRAPWGVGFTWMMDSQQEMREIIQWLRTHNRGRPVRDKAHFYGVDLTGGNGDWRPFVDRISEYLDSIDPGIGTEWAGRVRPIVDRFVGLGDAGGLDNHPYLNSMKLYGELPAADRHALAAFLNEVVLLLENARPLCLERTAKHEYLWALQTARSLRRSATTFEAAAGALDEHGEVAKDVAETVRIAGTSARDAAMAENVRWVLDQQRPGTRVVVMAHNAHVQKVVPRLAGSADDLPEDLKRVQGMVPAGVFLKSMLGDAYASVGLVFNTGDLWPGGVLPGVAASSEEAPADTLDGILARAGHDVFMIDLSSVPAAGPVREWFERPQRSMLAPMFSLLDPIIEAWDIVVFVDHVRRGTPVAPAAADD